MQALYEQAGAGNPVTEMGHISVGSNYLGNSIGSDLPRMFVDTLYSGSNAHGGWLFIRHTHQTVAELLLPPPPLLFAVLIMRWEIPWARVFPLRSAVAVMSTALADSIKSCLIGLLSSYS